MILGITGSIGSGKTTVANLFRKYGFRVINVDKFYANIYKKNRSLRNKINKEFGTTSRSKLKEIVFNDYKKLKKLNQITHPIIISEIKKSIKNIKKDSRIIIDAPLLIEARATDLVDKIVVVKCNEKTQISRVLKPQNSKNFGSRKSKDFLGKKRYTKKEIKNIIKSQMPLNKKLEYADFVIDNSYSLNKTKKQVDKIIKNLKI